MYQGNFFFFIFSFFSVFFCFFCNFVFFSVFFCFFVFSFFVFLFFNFFFIIFLFFQIQFSNVNEFSYKWFVTFVRSSSVNLTAAYGRAANCDTSTSLGIQTDSWIEVQEVRPRTVTTLLPTYSNLNNILPNQTSITVGGKCFKIL